MLYGWLKKHYIAILNIIIVIIANYTVVLNRQQDRFRLNLAKRNHQHNPYFNDFRAKPFQFLKKNQASSSRLLLQGI